MKHGAIMTTISVLVWIAILLSPSRSPAHMTSGSGIATQNIVTHPDATISASASPTPVLQPNPNRVTATCQNTDQGGTGNTARVGDSNVGASQGVVLYAKSGGAVFDTTGAVYAYSAGGTTVGCNEVTR